jgi:hypothetical protein
MLIGARRFEDDIRWGCLDVTRKRTPREHFGLGLSALILPSEILVEGSSSD